MWNDLKEKYCIDYVPYPRQVVLPHNICIFPLKAHLQWRMRSNDLDQMEC